jgi:hypothetical protein
LERDFALGFEVVIMARKNPKSVFIMIGCQYQFCGVVVTCPKIAWDFFEGTGKMLPVVLVDLSIWGGKTLPSSVIDEGGVVT